jgi:hypothetical protein
VTDVQAETLCHQAFDIDIDSVLCCPLKCQLFLLNLKESEQWSFLVIFTCSCTFVVQGSCRMQIL